MFPQSWVLGWLGGWAWLLPLYTHPLKQKGERENSKTKVTPDGCPGHWRLGAGLPHPTGGGATGAGYVTYLAGFQLTNGTPEWTFLA